MRVVDAVGVAAALPFDELIARLRQGFREGASTPVRHHHEIERPGADPAVLLLMPAWRSGDVTGVKLVHVCAGNEAHDLPAVQGLYVLFDGPTGTPVAVMDGTPLTLRRTAAASALAASYLARSDARHMVMVGAGALASGLVHAHATVRPIRRVEVWNRTPARAATLAADLRRDGFDAVAVTDLEAAVREADIVSAATMSATPLIRGAWLKPGCHVDLVGAFKPAMRESDDEVMRRSTVVVDTIEGALAEAGDIVQAIASGALSRDRIATDLAGLCMGDHDGRRKADEITVFKSCGTALEDLVAARLVAAKLGIGP